MLKVRELKATTQKSYYKKAFIIIDNDNNMVYLQSYATIVCGYNTVTGEAFRYWNGYSRTTMQHINDFIKLYNICECMSKSDWERTALSSYPNNIRLFSGVNMGNQNYGLPSWMLY